MKPPAQPVDRATFLASLRNRSAKGVYAIALDGGELPVSVNLRESPSLVFSFTGAAANRGNFSLPHFAVQGLQAHVPASIIGFSDPSLERDIDLKAAWFSGHEAFEVQKFLPSLIREMIEHTGATRVAFVGGSSGGFAALFYSWHIPGSIAVVTNPQTNFERYLKSPIDEYRAVCWPSLPNDVPLNDAIDTDLCALYASRFENTVIYLQVSSDYTHLKSQFTPFVATLPRNFAKHLIVRMANWGGWGHKPAPAGIWIPWLNAALSAPDTTAAAIEQTWEEQNPVHIPPLQPLVQPPGRDEQIATELARTAADRLLGA